ncbi:MAG: 2-C-methyl-D-erythritol 4-phosphate cytidylyltransferase [Parachlamydiales bacterium]|nr:2-C-methyl-D-erythritol 4-phosphate cytidylyltransferase [Parachlamydiales bacterium]
MIGCMYLGKRIGAILLMAGSGCRFGRDTPKQFCTLGGKKIYSHALDTMMESGLFDEIVLVSHPEWVEEGMIAGGATRQESSYRGLKAFKIRPDIVLIHDAVRPFVTTKILRENIEGAIEYGAVDTCIGSADTLVHAPDGKAIASIPNRREFLRGQTPQTFRMDWILEAHEKAGQLNATDDCQLVLRVGKPVHIVMGDEKNIKITTEFDLLIAEQIYTPV